MKKYFLVLVGAFLAVCVNVHYLTAAEEPAMNAMNAVNVDEDLEYTYGSVVSSSPAEIVINEYNYETDEEVQVAYMVNAETKLSNVKAAQDFVKDDNVDVYYKVIDGRKVVTMITKDETDYEAESDEDLEEDAAVDNSIELPEDPEIEIGNMTIGDETEE